MTNFRFLREDELPDGSIAEIVEDGWRGQRGGLKKYALALDEGAYWHKFMPPREEWNSIWPVYHLFHFTDGSLLLVSGRGKGHKMEVL